MTTFVPLALRLVQPDWTTAVPSPAHDALTPEERRRHLDRHPFSYLRVTRSPQDLRPDDGPLTRSELARQGREAVNDLIARGAFGAIEPARFYAYELHQKDTQGNRLHRQLGVVGGIGVGDYVSGVLRRHESIRYDRAQHLAEHLDVVGYQSSPVAAAFRPIPGLQQVLDRAATAEPLLTIDGDDGLTQRIWPLEGVDVGAFLSDVPTYLIDGHHRAAAAERFSSRGLRGEGSWLLTALFAADQLRNYAFHRNLRGIGLADVVDRIGDRLALRPIADLDELRRDEIALWGERHGAGQWLAVTIPLGRIRSTADEVANLDPKRLDDHLLAPVLGLDSGLETTPVEYRPATLPLAGLQTAALTTGSTLCVLRTVPMEVILAAADAGLALPPKSTYFEPKIRSGVFLRAIR